MFSVMAHSLSGAVCPVSLNNGTTSVADFRSALVKTLRLPIAADCLQLWHNGAVLARTDLSLRAAGVSSGDKIVFLLSQPLPKSRKPFSKMSRELQLPEILNGSDHRVHSQLEQLGQSRIDQALSRNNLLSADNPNNVQRLLGWLTRNHFSARDEYRISAQPKDEEKCISQLEKMGFSRAASFKALLLHRFEFDNALNWILEHSGDPELHKPLSDDEVRRLRQVLQREDDDDEDDDDESDDGSDDFC